MVNSEILMQKKNVYDHKVTVANPQHGSIVGEDQVGGHIKQIRVHAASCMLHGRLILYCLHMQACLRMLCIVWNRIRESLTVGMGMTDINHNNSHISW